MQTNVELFNVKTNFSWTLVSFLCSSCNYLLLSTGLTLSSARMQWEHDTPWKWQTFHNLVCHDEMALHFSSLAYMHECELKTNFQLQTVFYILSYSFVNFHTSRDSRGVTWIKGEFYVEWKMSWSWKALGNPCAAKYFASFYKSHPILILKAFVRDEWSFRGLFTYFVPFKIHLNIYDDPSSRALGIHCLIMRDNEGNPFHVIVVVDLFLSYLHWVMLFSLTEGSKSDPGDIVLK